MFLYLRTSQAEPTGALVMRTSVLCLVAALTISSVLHMCCAVPSAALYVKKESAQSASAAAASESASSETIVKKAGCGVCGKGASYVASKKSSAKSAVSSSSSSKSSYEAGAVSGGCGCTLLTEVQIKEKYAKLESETYEAYFKRIVSKSYSWTSTTEAYVKTLTTVWKDFSTLDLWYDRKYISYVKDFYTAYFAKTESETIETYYSRIVTKQAWETDELFAKRITVIRDCFPTLDLWTSDKWFNKYTKSIYALEFKRFAKESEVDYIKRIFERDEYFDTSDEIWAKRIFLAQEATFSSCDLWYNDAYLSYFTKFYKTWYKVTDKVTGDAWLRKVLAPLPGESYELALKRLTLIKKVTSDCGFWTVDYFKKIQVAKCFDEAWITKVQKAFFPCGCGGAVSIEKSSSSKSASVSSASASESSTYAKVVA